MTHKDTVVSVDCSTSSTKAIVWDKRGQPISEGRASYPLLNPQPSWWEQRPEDWWQATTAALREAMSGVDPQRVAALCMTHQRETFVPVDEGGHPLRNAILWLDERSSAELDDIDTACGSKTYHEISGKPLSTTPSLPKIIWIRKHEPAVFERAHKYLEVHAYLVFRMTGEYKTSWGCADPMGIFDMVGHCWSDDLLSAFGLRREQFAQVYPPGAVMGTVDAEAASLCGLPAGLPIVAALGDGQSAGLGAGITRPGQAYLNLGTAVVSGTYSARYVADPAFRTLTGGVPGTYLLETVLRGGTFTISWFVEKFGGLRAEGLGLGLSAEEVFESAAAKLEPGALGLMAIPYWNGVMNPYWDPSASGIVLGWRGAHGRAHLYRAILEGIGFEQRLATEGVEEALGLPIDGFVAMGGGSKSPLWCQIVADITGKPVTRSASPEASCLGAAILAATAAGFYDTVEEAAQAMVQMGRTYRPEPKAEAAYQRLYDEVYRHVFPAVQPLLGRLAELSQVE